MNAEIRTLAVGALTRVEGEGALHVTLTDGAVDSVELNIYEPPRFFEAFCADAPIPSRPTSPRVCAASVQSPIRSVPAMRSRTRAG